MTPPTLAAVAAHSGLWRIVPPARGLMQPAPSFRLLRVSEGRAHGASGPVVTVDAGTVLADFLADNPHLAGAEWIPVDARGERMAT